MNDAQINTEFKSRYHKLVAKLGRRPTFEEERSLNDWYREQFHDQISERKQIEKLERVVETKPTSGRCEHCGDPTKGGRFVAGHDAKLKGLLKKQAELGQLDAIVELLARDWPTGSLKVDLDTMAEATAKLDRVGADWIKERSEARYG